MYYTISECQSGKKHLQQALDEIARGGGNVVSVLNDHGGSALGVFGSGAVFNYLIVSVYPGDRRAIMTAPSAAARELADKIGGAVSHNQKLEMCQAALDAAYRRGIEAAALVARDCPITGKTIIARAAQEDTRIRIWQDIRALAPSQEGS